MTQPGMATDVAAQAASAAKIQGLADQLQSILASLQGNVDATASIWQGSAHTAFMGGAAEITAELQKGQATLQEVSEKTSKSGVNYGSTDHSNAAALGSTKL
ncbi:MAG: WXG100 family type VII secretion target [Mycolicibacterium sp.]|uniref:WXG100 family type VII secretion target n=1 Tax=Mycolicibacterium sp. TaxID=2320850 RepID=UPI003D0F0877